MSTPVKFDPVAMASFLTPVVIQGLSIAVFFVLSWGNSLTAIGGSMLSLIWLKVSAGNLSEELGDLRVKRHLFSVMGSWLNQDAAEDEFDKAAAHYLMLDEGVESDKYKAIVTASGIANLIRNILSFFIYGYLFYLSVVVLLSIEGIKIS